VLRVTVPLVLHYRTAKSTYKKQNANKIFTEMQMWLGFVKKIQIDSTGIISDFPRGVVASGGYLYRAAKQRGKYLPIL